MITKNQLEKENANLKFWIGYIKYRKDQNWKGASGDYIVTDITNILTRIDNELSTNHYSK